MRTYSPGDMAPPLILVGDDGEEVPLSELRHDGPLVVVFLRYFGCTFCRAHVSNVRDERETFADAGARVVLVGQGPPDRAASFCRERELPFLCTVDPDRRAYEAFGLGRARPRDLMDPKVAARGLRLSADRETRQGRISGDPRQLGGTVVIDEAGVIRFVHRNRTVWDDAPNDVVLAAVEEARRTDVEGRSWQRAS